MTAATVSDVRRGNIIIYVLAAPEDEAYCDKLQKHLKPTVMSSPVPIEMLDDFDIPPGAERPQHMARLLEADVVLSLISVDFIDDDSIYDRCQSVFRRFNDGQNVMVSVIVRNCLWKATPLAKFPILPTNRVPVDNWSREDDALTDVVQHLNESINAIGRIEVVADPPTPVVAAPATEPEQPNGVTATSESLPPPVAPENRTDASSTSWAAPTPPTAEPEHAAEAAPPPTARPGHTTNPGFAAPPMSGGGFAGAYRVVRDALPDVDVDWRKQYYQHLIWKRFWAYLIDSVLMFWLPAIVVLGLASTQETGDAAFGWIVLIALFVLTPFLESRYRGTPGKLLLKIEIANKDGTSISFGRAFIRNILRSVTFYSYMFVIPLVYQVHRFRRTKKLFHDEWSKTVIGEKIMSE